MTRVAKALRTLLGNSSYKLKDTNRTNARSFPHHASNLTFQSTEFVSAHTHSPSGCRLDRLDLRSRTGNRVITTSICASYLRHSMPAMLSICCWRTPFGQHSDQAWLPGSTRIG